MDKVKLLADFEQLTDELLRVNFTANIDEVITEIEEKLKKREDIIELINESGDDTIYEEDLMRIMQKNNMLETKLSELKLSISDSILKVVNEKSLSSIKKKAHRGYLNVGKQTDGYFIDKKK